MMGAVLQTSILRSGPGLGCLGEVAPSRTAVLPPQPRLRVLTHPLRRASGDEGGHAASAAKRVPLELLSRAQRSRRR